MMPEEWPIAALASDQTAPARAAGRGRLATVRADFLLDPAARLSEQERALMTAMLDCLLGDIADELRASQSGAHHAANDQDNANLMDRLARAGLLDLPELIALLLRRADEFRIWQPQRRAADGARHGSSRAWSATGRARFPPRQWR